MPRNAPSTNPAAAPVTAPIVNVIGPFLLTVSGLLNTSDYRGRTWSNDVLLDREEHLGVSPPLLEVVKRTKFLIEDVDDDIFEVH